MIPFKYTLRNLEERWVTTLMTVFATGLVVWACVLTFGMVDGLEHALRVGGDPLDLIVMRQGADNETSSYFEESNAKEIASLEGIARDESGQPLCSGEFVTILTKPRRNGGGTTNLIVRGLEPVGRELRPDFKIVEGRDLQAGVNELITSRPMAERFENLGLGEKLEINSVPFTVVGYFEAGGSAAESEVWTDIRDLASARRQSGVVSTVTVRARDQLAKQALLKQLRDDEQFKKKVVDEVEYFEDQMTASIAIKFVSLVIASFLTFGAMFGAANTMYAAVAARGRELGALRAIGFSRRSIILAVMRESLIICLLGGVLGCLATLPLNGISTGTANWATFSEITFSFRYGPDVLLQGVVLAIAMGLIGGLFPAVHAVRIPITTALRQV
jgi:putative ABC transport system permease protein